MKDYKQIWDNLSGSFDDAAFFVCCVGDEDEIRSNGALTATFLREVLQIEPHDKVLEIGCGIARIGRELAPHCGEWHGADISGNMIAYARERTQGISNIHLHELPGSHLSIFADNYFDCVYSTIVFMHLDKLEMFTYIREAYRVLAPGGRVYFDTYNILAPQAWEEFRGVLDKYPYGNRPGHVSQFSTPQEMRKFMEEAGFRDVHVDGENNQQLVIALGRKSAAKGFRRSRTALRAGRSGEQEVARAGDIGLQVVGLDPTANAWRNEAEMLNKLALARSEYIAALQEEIERLHVSIEGKNEYITAVDQVIDAKNRHIARLEGLVQRYEALLGALPVRIALRLRKAITRGK
jgi:SAM-dependent methyltransferase/uncharacterized small protein (DUF1192 family)